MKFIPIFDRLVIDVKPTDRTKGGIVLPEASNVVLYTGIITACGQGPLVSSGAIGPMPVKVGDEIVFMKQAIDTIEIAGEKFDTLLLSSVMGILERS